MDEFDLPPINRSRYHERNLGVWKQAKELKELTRRHYTDLDKMQTVFLYQKKKAEETESPIMELFKSLEGPTLQEIKMLQIEHYRLVPNRRELPIREFYSYLVKAIYNAAFIERIDPRKSLDLVKRLSEKGLIK